MGSKEEKKEEKKNKSISRNSGELGRGRFRGSPAWRGVEGRGTARVVRGAGYRSASGALVHEPVALKACLCLASLLEAHLLISTKEKNGVGNMRMSSPPCLGSQGPRARYSAWGRKQGEQVLKVLGESDRKSQAFSVLSMGRERGEKHPQSCSE